MDIQEYDSAEAFFTEQGENWRRVADSSPAATIFQTAEWLTAWWRFNGRGLRFLGLAVTENGQFVGGAMLMLPNVLVPLRTLCFVGTGGSDYLDIVASPGYEKAVSEVFFRWLAENRRRFDWGDFQQVRPGAVVAEALPEQGSLRAELWQGETCPYLPLAPTYTAFTKTLGKKLRQNIGYYERSIEKQFESVVYRLATEETLTGDLNAFFDLHQQRWNKRWLPGAFYSDTARKYHGEVAAKFLKAGYLRLHTLTIDSRIRAALYCFQKGRTCYYYLGGFDPELAKLSIGTVLTARAIRHAIEADGAEEFDFLRGDEGYKYRWGALDRHNRRLSVTTGSVRSSLLEKMGRTSLSIEQRLKTFMHSRHGGAGGKKKEE